MLSVEVLAYSSPIRAYQLTVDRFESKRRRSALFRATDGTLRVPKAFGFTVFWVNRARAPVEELGVTPDYELNSLAELPSRCVTA